MSEKKTNVIQFKKTLDEISAYANKKCDEGDYSAALYALYFYTKRKNCSRNAYAHMADIYSEMGFYDLAIDKWNEFLSSAPEEYYADGFNGLGANYYFKGDREKATYYFDRQFECPGAESCLYNDVLDEFMNDREEYDDDFRSQFHIAYSADGKSKYEEYLETARKCNAGAEYEKAVKNAEKAAEYNSIKGDALWEKSYAEFSLNDNEAAKKDLELALAELGDKITVREMTLPVYLYSTLCDDEKCREYLGKIAASATEGSDERYMQVATLYDYEDEESAVKLLDKYLPEFPFERGLLHLKGVLEYNRGDYSRARELFAKEYVYTLNPNALYYKKLADKAESGKVEIKKIGVSFDIPTDVAEERLSVLLRLFRREIKIGDVGADTVREYVDWAIASEDTALQTAAGLICVQNGETFKRYLSKKLVLGKLSGEIKRKYVSMLCDFGFYGEIGMTYNGYFKKIIIDMPCFAQRGYEQFTAAYSYALGLCTMLFDCDYSKLYGGAENFQRLLIRNKAITKAKDVCSLACAIFVYSDAVKTSANAKKMLYKFFNAKKENVDELLSYADEGKI